jgi:hypothetical protein
MKYIVTLLVSCLLVNVAYAKPIPVTIVNFYDTTDDPLLREMALRDDFLYVKHLFKAIKVDVTLKDVVSAPHPCQQFRDYTNYLDSYLCAYNYGLKNYRHTKTHLIAAVPYSTYGDWHIFWGLSFICQNRKQYSFSGTTVEVSTDRALQCAARQSLAHELGHALGAGEQPRHTLMNPDILSMIFQGGDYRMKFNAITKNQIRRCQSRFR